MKIVLGIGIDRERVRVVAIRRGTVLWASEAGIGAGKPLERVLPGLLASAPIRRWQRPTAIVAVGPADAQVKKISGLPPVTDLHALARIVQEGAGRFFLHNDAPVVTTGVQMIGPGQVWAAAIDKGILQRIEDGCEAAGVRIEAIAPVGVVLGAALEDEKVTWLDRDAGVEITMREHRLEHIRRFIPDDSAAEPSLSKPVVGLARLGEGAWRFADAYGAAMLSRGEQLAFRPAARNGRVPTWRVVVAVLACAVAVTFAILAPIARAIHSEREALARLANVGTDRLAVIETERDLIRVTAALTEVAAFDAKRFPVTLLLADLARVLPESSAVATVRIDTTAATTLVVLTPSVATLLGSLDKVPWLLSPEIVGPITRERVAEHDLERATIRFRVDLPEQRRRVLEAVERP